jgi:hypothetical protein
MRAERIVKRLMTERSEKRRMIGRGKDSKFCRQERGSNVDGRVRLRMEG